MSGSLNITIPSNISIYTNLIPSANNSQPNFMATIAATVQPFSDLTQVILSFPLDFDLNTAVGSQLDTVGLWVGVTRDLSQAINTYFSFNESGLGFNQAPWYNIGDATSGIVILDDATYRTLLQARIVSNHWNGTVQGAYSAWNTFFASQSTANGIAIQDLGSMQMIFALTGPQPSNTLVDIFEDGEINLSPAGVLVYLCLPTVYPAAVSGGTPFFGLDVNNSVISGLNTGALVTIASTS